MLYTVGEMAKRLGVAPSTLRFYDKEGLPEEFREIRMKLRGE